MLQRLTTLVVLFIASTLMAQTQYKELTSSKLREKRQIKIQLPRNYDASTEQAYPVIVVLDGDYLFEPVAGAVDYNSYWEEMPDAIVVGINMDKSRDADTYYSDVSYLPEKTGADFFEFVGMEVMGYIDENYKTTNFRMVVGHDLTANFMNYYLMKSPTMFQGYVSLSPDLAPSMEKRLIARMGALKQKIFYYLATGTDDIKQLRNETLQLDNQIRTVENENLTYFFDDFKDASHYSLVGRAIPKALETFFSVYRPISKREYKEQLLADDNNPYDYLVKKYGTVKDLFGLDGAIRTNDFVAVSTALEKREDWDGLEKLGQLARKQYPDTMLGNYYLALVKEKIGEPKRAMRMYQNAFLLEEVAFVTKDMMLQRAERIRTDFGYK